MQTIKTAVVVVLLLVVLYGAYVAINGTETQLPPDVQAMIADEASLDIDVSMPFGPSMGGATAVDPQTAFGSKINPNPTFGNSKPASASSSNFDTPQPLPLPATFDPPSSSAEVKTETASSFATPKREEKENLDVPAFSLGGNDLEKGSSVSQSGIDKALEAAFPNTDAEGRGNDIPPLPASTQVGFQAPSLPSAYDFVSDEADGSEPVLGDSASSSGGMDAFSGSGDMNDRVTITGRSYANAKQKALEQIDRGQLKEALATLSVFYNSPELSSEQSRDLLDLLDSLAAEVIYSQRHLLDTPYVVGPGETIEGIARKFEVPSELLARINNVTSPNSLMPNTKLKVFQGPFRAEIELERSELTIFLGDLYAGRFPISIGNDPRPRDGVYQVLEKQRNRNYYGKGGVQIEGNDPRNPFGGWWIDLGQDISIHGSAESPASENPNFGCISLSPLDARDVYSMLSRGSQVTIR